MQKNPSAKLSPYPPFKCIFSEPEKLCNQALTKTGFYGHTYKRGKNNIGLITSWINMTQQPTEPNNNNQSTPQTEKLLIDDPSHFQFHAAYLVYSDTFDAVTDAQGKKELNQNLEDLKANKIDYETFYLNISHYRNWICPDKKDSPCRLNERRTGARKRSGKSESKDTKSKSVGFFD